MNDYINKWISIISNCKTDNTYKMAWGKSLVEYAHNIDNYEDEHTIYFSQLAPYILKYYWNQTIYFDLIQGQNPQKEPVVKQLTEKLINLYYKKVHSKMPERFEKIDFKKIGLEKEYLKCIEKITKVLGENVSFRFLNVKNNILDIYFTKKKMNHLVIKGKDLKMLHNYADILFHLINYRWTQILEGFNTSPKIANKVKGTHDLNGIQRSNLKRFHEILLIENPEKRCFYTNEILNEQNLSVDHIIPWSFMYSDDPWNLVFCDKGENSSKSNGRVDEHLIKRVEERNKKLVEIADERKINNKSIELIKQAIERDLLRKFWIASKG